jgi:hypothetical protein
MKPPIRRLFLALAVCTVAVRAFAHPAADEMAAAASKFLAALNDAQRVKAVYSGVKDEARYQWHFIPTEMVTFGRKGVSFETLDDSQRALGLALLRSAMSEAGYGKATKIMSLEAVLKVLESANARVDRNPIKYFISVYGKPDAKGTWGWRFEGHHLSLSFTIVDGKLFSGTPSFMGSNPAEVREGPRKGVRVLGREEDLARQLVKSLNASQQSAAVFDKVAPKDIITAADRTAKALSPEGIAYGKLDAKQQAQLKALVGEYVNRIRPDLAKMDLDKIGKAGWDKVHFAWAGPLEPGEGHYYRVQGPTFLLEYDNTQNGANHVHAVWRDFNGDFGDDLLKKHYAEAHGK